MSTESKEQWCRWIPKNKERADKTTLKTDPDKVALRRAIEDKRAEMEINKDDY